MDLWHCESNTGVFGIFQDCLTGANSPLRGVKLLLQHDCSTNDIQKLIESAVRAKLFADVKFFFVLT